MDLKTGQNRHFGKGIVHDFGQKVEVLSFLCLSKRDREKVFANVLDKKRSL